MKKNMGMLDRAIRIIAASIIFGLYITDTVTGTTAIVLSIIGVVLVLTSFIRFCPLYLPFGLSTVGKKKNN